MNYVVVAYVLAFVVIGGYALSVVLRRREVERSISAWSERPGPGHDAAGESRGRIGRQNGGTDE